MRNNMKQIVYSFLFIALLLCSCHPSSPKSEITAEMAYEGVNNYCHSHYDWSVAEENPDVMYVRMGEESDTAYQVIFRSYTGAFVYFTVDKASGMTTMKEVVPNVDVESDAGEFSLYDYLHVSD